MLIAESERLIIKHLTEEDAAFILDIYNTEGFLQYIGDRNIRSLQDAKQFLIDSPLKMYREKGISLYRVDLKETNTPIGLSGLIKRDTLQEIDLGYAFLPAYFGKGYALESANLVLDYAKNTLGLERVLAITQADNKSSIALLKKLGMKYNGPHLLEDDDADIDLYSLELE